MNSPTTQALVTAVAHDVVLTMGIGDPDHVSAHAAQEHRRLLREEILGTIADYLKEAG
jgi:hypothetical protein